MCGIVGAVSKRDVVPMLLEGLQRLEYRGYDSAGIAVLNNGKLDRIRVTGKVSNLRKIQDSHALSADMGIAHTRWATHGKPSEQNAHPHVCNESIAVVHNGIIENHESLRQQQLEQGYRFTSETDTEVIAHQLYHYLEQGMSLLGATKATVKDLEGAYALAIISKVEPEYMVVARRGSPLVIGLGENEHLIASDVAALLPVTNRFLFLEEGDIATIQCQTITIYDSYDKLVRREEKISKLSTDATNKGEYNHFMLKEIYEQPWAITETLEGRIHQGRLLENGFGPEAHDVFNNIDHVSIIACGTSYHAGLVARYWFETIAGISCSVEVASEFRYRRPAVVPNSLLVVISQSGETADTLAALRVAKERGFRNSLAICNVPESSIVREADLSLMTRAGPEIGVASTKAFTTQLVCLMLLVIALGRRHQLVPDDELKIVSELESLPRRIEHVLGLDENIQKLASNLTCKNSALFLGRGALYPIALEGALKLKEISYIHAEAYPAGELKHGPLALVDINMPVIAVAPNDDLLEKLKSNLQEVRARGSEMYVFADSSTEWEAKKALHVEPVESVEEFVSPIIFTIPLQLLAYHVAVQKGTDVDQPRNLAKSVTVE